MGCRFLVIANGIAAGYSLIQGLRCAVSMIKGSVLFDKALALVIFSCDQVCGKFFGVEPLHLSLQTCVVRLVLVMISISCVQARTMGFGYLNSNSLNTDRANF